ncbi:bifunctional phosphopantothenoylcysteine decarboxylase/phosphopantothenate--cysteine ligase CoaBC [candidate division KSB1 bacterium]
MTLCLSGSIAVYKAAEILRRLRGAGAEVRVVMTESAAKLVSPVTFAALSGNPVACRMFPDDPGDSPAMPHLEFGQGADLVLVAPATANVLAKAAVGIADDLVSALILAADCPLVFAPAMNSHMYLNPVTLDNIQRLQARGCHIIGPDEGELAEGVVGPGRMVEPEQIVAAVLDLLAPASILRGKTVLVTAGPTHEPIDPVRIIANRSSGKMGYALAAEAVRRGAAVTLVSGPTSLNPPPGADLVAVRTTAEMRQAVIEAVPKTDLLVMAAAPADFRPKEVAAGKLARKSDGLTLELVSTPDIIKEAVSANPEMTAVGFALETGDGEARARQKLKNKGCHLIVLNNPTEPGAGFEVDTNRVTIIDRSGRSESHPVMQKTQVAALILDRVEELFHD